MPSNFSYLSLNIKWNTFRIIQLINKKCVEHRIIDYYNSVGIRSIKNATHQSLLPAILKVTNIDSIFQNLYFAARIVFG